MCRGLLAAATRFLATGHSNTERCPDGNARAYTYSEITKSNTETSADGHAKGYADAQILLLVVLGITSHVTSEALTLS